MKKHGHFQDVVGRNLDCLYDRHNNSSWDFVEFVTMTTTHLWDFVEFDGSLHGHVLTERGKLDVNKLLWVERPVPVPVTELTCAHTFKEMLLNKQFAIFHKQNSFKFRSKDDQYK